MYDLSVKMHLCIEERMEVGAWLDENESIKSSVALHVE